MLITYVLYSSLIHALVSSAWFLPIKTRSINSLSKYLHNQHHHHYTEQASHLRSYLRTIAILGFQILCFYVLMEDWSLQVWNVTKSRYLLRNTNVHKPADELALLIYSLWKDSPIINFNYILLILRIKLLRNSLINQPEIPNNTKNQNSEQKEIRIHNERSQQQKSNDNSENLLVNCVFIFA